MKRRPITWILFAAALIGVLVSGAVPALAASARPGAIALPRQDDGAWR